MNPPISPPPYGFYRQYSYLGDDGGYYETPPPPSTSPEETYGREKKQLMRQLNAANGSNLSADDFIWSTPVAADRGRFITGNTQLTLRPVYWSNYKGEFSFSYERLNLQTALAFPSLIAQVDRENETLLSQLMPKINALFGIDMQIGDYKDVALPVVDPQYPAAALSVAIESNEASFAYQGTFLLPLGPAAAQVTDEGITRRLYVLKSDGMVDSVAENFKQVDNPWLYFRNATNLVITGATKLYPGVQGGLIAVGDFSFTATIAPATLPEDITAATVHLDKAGSVLSYSDDLAFDGLVNAQLARSSFTDAVYAPEMADRVRKYDLQGRRVSEWTLTGVLVPPELVEQDALGRLLLVSAVHDAPIELDGDVVGPQYRIDRCLPNGELDLTFSPVIITGQGNTQPIKLADIRAVPSLQGGGFYAVFNGFQSGIISSQGVQPVINGMTLVEQPVESNYGLNPVVHFTDLGKRDRKFATPKTYSQIWITMGEYLTQGDRVLNVTTKNVSYYTQRFNIETGQPHRQPITFERDGTIVRLSINEMADTYRWTESTQLRTFSNGGFAAFGKATLPVQGGGFGPPLSVVCKYDSNGVPKKVLYHVQPTPPLVTPTIVEVVVSEYDTRVVPVA